MSEWRQSVELLREARRACAQMNDQMYLIESVPWDVLIVLDACRADAFEQACTIVAHRVQSPGCCTGQWLCAMAQMLRARDVLYYTANPIVDRENGTQDLRLRLASLWQRHWGRFGSDAIPSVHPMSVTAVVLEDWHTGTWCGPRVVHYLQPHCPYIGEPPLNAGRWYSNNRPLGTPIGHLREMIASGELSWPTVRQAYLGNLRLAWDAVRNLVAALDGLRIVITADHGNLLGEGGLYGHEPNWKGKPELHTVPWLDVVGGKRIGEPQPPAEERATQAKLEALGYV